MRCMSRIPEKDDVLVVPLAVAHAGKGEPRSAGQMSRVVHELVTVEVVREELLAEAVALGLRHLVDPESAPRFLRALDDEGTRVVVEAIAVHLNPAVLRFLEDERERIEGLVRTEPDKLVLAHLDIWLEMLGIFRADLAVEPVASDEQVVLADIGERIHLHLEVEVDTELSSALLQDEKHLLAGQARETMAARADALAFEVNVDVVPVVERRKNAFRGDRVVFAEIFQRLVGEDDPPTKGIVRAVALVDVDFMGRIPALGRNREVETARSASDASDLHVRRILYHRAEPDSFRARHFLSGFPA